jgi:hypothetical protein
LLLRLAQRLGGGSRALEAAGDLDGDDDEASGEQDQLQAQEIGQATDVGLACDRGAHQIVLRRREELCAVVRLWRPAPTPA